MPDYNTYLLRHGEFWIQAIVEQQERYAGVRANDNMTLEERWSAVMESRQPPRAGT